MEIKVVGWREVGELLQPGHAYFADKRAWITDFSHYNGGDEWLLYPRVKCEDRLNPYRKRQLSRGHTSRTIRKLLGVIQQFNLEEFKVADLILTMPRELSTWLCEQPKGRDMAWRIFHRFWAEDYGTLDEDSGGQAAYVNLHTWKTEDPTKPHYHFHTLIPNYRQVEDGTMEDEDGDAVYGLERKTWYKQRGGTEVPWSDEIALELKRRWWVRLRKFARRHGLNVGVLEKREGYQSIDVHMAFVRLGDELGRAKLMHKINYQSRHPIEDYATHTNRDLEAEDPPEWLTSYANRTRVFGWWRQIGSLAQGAIEETEDRPHPVTGEAMAYQGRISLEGALMNCEGRLGYLDVVRGKPITGELDSDDLLWLRSVMWERCESY